MWQGDAAVDRYYAPSATLASSRAVCMLLVHDFQGDLGYVIINASRLNMTEEIEVSTESWQGSLPFSSCGRLGHDAPISTRRRLKGAVLGPHGSRAYECTNPRRPDSD